MKRKIITTADGSKTIQIEEWDEQYHSKHGAIQEAYHVFIKSGLSLFGDAEISILEIGFGTGLNALITTIEAPKSNLIVNYTAVEAYPVSAEEIKQLDYATQLGATDSEKVYDELHAASWEQCINVTPTFTLQKRKQDFLAIKDENIYDLIYFDAFGARVQPELWTETIFTSMFKSLKSGGVLVTYSAKGSVRRAMIAVGFIIERLPGPPGKREMLRATKP